jgi:hypothetical protein
MDKRTAAAIVLVSLLSLTMLGMFGAAVLDLRHDCVTRDLWTWTGLCGLLPLFIAVATAYSLLQGARWLRTRVTPVHHRNGQLPASVSPKIVIHAPQPAGGGRQGCGIWPGPDQCIQSPRAELVAAAHGQGGKKSRGQEGVPFGQPVFFRA